MPRKNRLFLPNTPQHIVVRGHNRAPILARHEDFQFMYRCVLNAAAKNQLAVHAWVFMHNHLHLLATPEHNDSAAKTMQSIGRRYAHYFNKNYGRSGALWEGRYKAALVDNERYLLCCYRYIELNPVRAGLAKQPQDYPYSSYHHNALGKADKLITPHEVYLGLCAGTASNPTPKISATTNNSSSKHYHAKTLPPSNAAPKKNSAIGSNQFRLKIAELLT